MGRRGRKPTPTALRLLRGNPRRRPINRREPRPAPASLACPAWLTSEARAYWLRYAPEAERIGVLTIVDVGKFEALCRAYQQWRRYERLCDRASGELAIAKGYVNAALKQRQQFAQLAAAFGFDPSSRSNVKVTAPETPSAARLLLLRKPTPAAS